MRRVITLTLLLACVTAALAAPKGNPVERGYETLKTFPPNSCGVHITGGKQGRNDWYVVDLKRGDFYVMNLGRKSAGRLTAPELTRWRNAMESAGFFSWKPAYTPSTRGADVTTTEIFCDDGKRRHRVICTEPADAPKGFMGLARRFELLAFASYWHSFSYQYVTGRLQHVDLEGGFWTIVYATGDEAEKDKYGGKFVLEVDGGMLAGFKDGDLVLLTGGVSADRMGIQMAGTYYKVKRIEPLR